MCQKASLTSNYLMFLPYMSICSVWIFQNTFGFLDQKTKVYGWSLPPPFSAADHITCSPQNLVYATLLGLGFTLMSTTFVNCLGLNIIFSFFLWALHWSTVHFSSTLSSPIKKLSAVSIPYTVSWLQGWGEYSSQTLWNLFGCEKIWTPSLIWHQLTPRIGFSYINKG